MSRREIIVWCWLLAGLAIGAGLSVVLSGDALITLACVVIGFLIVLALPGVLYAFCVFAVNGVLSLVLPRPWWLRLAVSLGLVVLAAHLVSVSLNRDTLRAFDRRVAMDMPLAARPPYRRLVLVDNRAGQPLQGTFFRGDLIVRRLPDGRGCHAQPCERTEVYLMEAAGPRLIERQTSFEMQAYAFMPLPARAVSWDGSIHDEGVQWKGWFLVHKRSFDEVVRNDLGLDKDGYDVRSF